MRAAVSHPENGGLSTVISRERSSRPKGEGLFYGTLDPLPPGTGLAVEPGRAPPAGLERWATAVVVAFTIRDATVIAGVRFEHLLAVHPAPLLHVYRVEANPFHSGPLAVVEELRRRGVAHDGLVQEYWSPSEGWHIREVLAPSLVVVEEVPPLSERDLYVPRWVLYRQDAERARALF